MTPPSNAPELRISETLALPLDAATRATAILAVRGAGKTYTSAVLSEEVARAGVPVVVIDPVGVGWGLAYDAADSKKRGGGLPVVIFGGDRADVPLEENAGELVADVIVRERFSAVLDLSHLRKGARKRFVLDFLEKLYDANREPIVLVVDEADMFAPQKPLPGDQRLVGSMEDVVRRGRAHGIGVYLVTQRAAVLNKDVLTQCEMLIALRVTHPKDRAAIEDWIELHGTEEQRAEVFASLPTLKNGEAWVWSPPYDLLQRIQVRRRTTFDSSATPKPGEKRIEPTKRAEVDLDALRTKFVASIERAKAEDPKTLRAELAQREARIEELEEMLAAAVHQTAPMPEPIEVPLLTEEVRAELRDAIEWVDRVVSKIADGIEVARRPSPSTRSEPTPRPSPRPPPPLAPGARPAPLASVRTAPASSATTRTLKRGAREMLSRLAALADAYGFATRAQLATLTGIKVNGSTFSTYMSALTMAGYVAQTDGAVHITAEGRRAAGVVAPIGSTADVVALYGTSLKLGARQMLDQVVAHHPRVWTRDQLARSLGIDASGSTFSTYLSMLASNGLVERRGDEVVPTDALFLGARGGAR